MRTMPGSWSTGLLATAVGLALVATTSPASAHGVRLKFEDWGGFSPGGVRCQRSIARAAAKCAATAWAVRRACLSARMNGQPCDENAAQAAVEQARRAATDDVDARCSELQVFELQFLGSFDLQADVTNFCRAWQTAAESAVFGPVPDQAPLPGDRARCVAAAAAATTDVLELVGRQRRTCMDRIASLPLAAAKRGPLLDVGAHRIGHSVAAVAERLAAHCAPEQFAAIYGRSPAQFVAGIAARADCIGGAFYIQDAVLCPAAVCGNGIIEPDESCDDGSVAGGDACPADCRSRD